MGNIDQYTNRLIHVFGCEIIEYEITVSQQFLSLQNTCKSERPNGSIAHRHIRLILSDAAKIGLIFFPVVKKNTTRTTRAEILRREFGVLDDSLLKDRDLRHDLEHLDERLDTWAATSARKTFGRAMLGSRNDAQRLGITTEDILGIFDPENMIYSFKDNDICIDDLVFEIQRVAHDARRKLRETPWK